MESTPVVGVETRNERVALVLAPSFLREAATGMTPQEHMGNGIPRTVALIMDPRVLPPRCRTMKLLPRKTCNIPAMNNPSTR